MTGRCAFVEVTGSAFVAGHGAGESGMDLSQGARAMFGVYEMTVIYKTQMRRSLGYHDISCRFLGLLVECGDERDGQVRQTESTKGLIAENQKSQIRDPRGPR